MTSKLTKQILALGMLVGFLGVTLGVFFWYPEKVEILLGAWIALIQLAVKEYFGEPGDANGQPLPPS